MLIFNGYIAISVFLIRSEDSLKSGLTTSILNCSEAQSSSISKAHTITRDVVTHYPSPKP